MKKKTIVSSLLTIVLCLSLIAGSTYALFTSEDEVNIAITSGEVSIVATILDGMKTYSLDEEQAPGAFANGGKATFTVENDEKLLNLEKMTPGDKVAFTIQITNNSNVIVKYRVTWDMEGDLAEALKVTVDDKTFEAGTSAWETWPIPASENDKVETIDVVIELPADTGNEYQEKLAKITFTVEAIQGNAPEVDKWDGTADTAWFTEADADATEFTLTTAEAVAGLATLVDGGEDFEGKTIKLESDLDLAGVAFNPIGHSANGQAFKGVFDGQGHTISNLYQQSDLGAWQYEGEYYGLFAYTDGATIKNVTIADAYISSGRNEAAGVVGNAVDTTFSDITISNVTLIAYNNSAGGVAAECYGNCSFNNITVDEETVIGPLWGTYDVRLGGVVGLVHAGNNVTFSNITVACQLDAINDVASNYQYWLYRYSGMLIGHVDAVNGVADPTGYVTCENVKVIYGDWVNYHYCEFASLGAGSYNGPGEYKFARVEAGTGTDGIDLNTCNHAEDESHNVLIVFDQLFGGGQGVSGLKTYDGVEVIYPEN